MYNADPEMDSVRSKTSHDQSERKFQHFYQPHLLTLVFLGARSYCLLTVSLCQPERLQSVCSTAKSSKG